MVIAEVVGAGWSRQHRAWVVLLRHECGHVRAHVAERLLDRPERGQRLHVDDGGVVTLWLGGFDPRWHD